MRTLILLLVICASVARAQQNPDPAPLQTKSVLIMNGIAHIGNGEVIENSVIGFDQGKIQLVADARLVRIDMTAYDTIIDATGQHIYPGFIATNSTLGLHEIDAVRAQNDLSDVGTFRPGLRSSTSYNTDSEIIPTVRSNGILMGQIVPRGGTLSGTSCVMQFDAWNWEDALIRQDDGVHVNWPRVYHKHYDKGVVKIERVKSYDQQLTEIRNFFAEAQVYTSLKSPQITEVRFEALRGVFSGEQTLYVHADDVNSIQEALLFKSTYGIPSMVIVGGYDAWMVAKELKEANVPVMLGRIHSLPRFNDDDIELPYKLPSMLYKLGVRFCFQNEGDMERMGLRNLPFHAGTAVAYGLPYEEAIRALTLTPAEVLGIADQCGTLEPGKDATLFISAGDALDVRSNQLTFAFIQGRSIDLSSKQTQLYEKYKKKYGSR